MKRTRTKDRIIPISHEIEIVAINLKKRSGIVINNNAKRYVAKQVTKSVQAEVIQPENEKMAIAALYVAGVKHAVRYGDKRVTTSHIQKVWGEIRMCTDNCPPGQCLNKTVISRVEEFGDDFPLFNEIK